MTIPRHIDHRVLTVTDLGPDEHDDAFRGYRIVAEDKAIDGTVLRTHTWAQRPYKPRTAAGSIARLVGRQLTSWPALTAQDVVVGGRSIITRQP